MPTGGRRAHGPFAARLKVLLGNNGKPYLPDECWQAIEDKLGLEKPIDPVIRETLSEALLEYSHAVGLEAEAPLWSNVDRFERILKSTLDKLVDLASGSENEDMALALGYRRDDPELAARFEELGLRAALLRADLNKEVAALRGKSAREVARLPKHSEKQTAVLAFERFLKATDGATTMLGLEQSRLDKRYILLVSELTGVNGEACRSRIDEFRNPRKRK